MRINLGLDLLPDDQLRHLGLDLVQRQVEGFGDLSKVDYFVGCHILNQSLFPDGSNDLVQFMSEKGIKSQLISNTFQRLLEFHVMSIQEVLYDVRGSLGTSCLHHVLEVGGGEDMGAQFLPR